jgi:hypothetical protein
MIWSEPALSRGVAAQCLALTARAAQECRTPQLRRSGGGDAPGDNYKDAQ